MNPSLNSPTEPCWISASDPLPNVCVDCGMFSDQRTKLKHVSLVQRPADENQGCGAVLFVLFLHLLGPIGWIIALLTQHGKQEDGSKIVKEKTRVKIPQCHLCHGVAAPLVVEADPATQRLLLNVHPNFVQRLAEERAKRAAERAPFDF